MTNWSGRFKASNLFVIVGIAAAAILAGFIPASFLLVGLRTYFGF